MKDVKVVFMGTPEFSVPILEMLIEKTNVVLVVTQPDKMVGRHQEIAFSPVKKVALKHSIPVFQPNKIKEDFEEVIKAKPDIIITCAYGQFIPKELLNYPKYHCINVHASLLPKYRGGSPIHTAIIRGEDKTGVTIMYMVQKMDAGDIISQEAIPIEKSDTVGSLHDKLSILGRDLLLKTLPSIFNGTNASTPQEEKEVSFAYDIKREEEHLDFTKNGVDIINQIRGLNPWPTANLHFNTLEYKILEAYFIPTTNSKPKKIVEIKKNAIGIGAKDGIVYITKLKPFGKKEMDAQSFINGIKKEEWLNKEVS